MTIREVIEMLKQIYAFIMDLFNTYFGSKEEAPEGEAEETV